MLELAAEMFEKIAADGHALMWMLLTLATQPWSLKPGQTLGGTYTKRETTLVAARRADQ